MNWVIAKNARCSLLTFQGSDFSGSHSTVEIFPSGRQGDIDGEVRSLQMVAPIGARIVLCAAVSEDGWEQRPWRAVVMTKENSFETKDGKRALRIPDVEALDAISARRTDPDFETSYDFAESLDSGKGWTYGRPGPLRGQVRTIRVDRLPAPEKK